LVVSKSDCLRIEACQFLHRHDLAHPASILPSFRISVVSSQPPGHSARRRSLQSQCHESPGFYFFARCVRMDTDAS
jgi:hypothetical protein